MQIRKMNIQERPSEMEFKKEAERIFKTNEIAKPIKTEGDEVLKNVFITEKMSKEEVCDAYNAALQSRNAITDEIKVYSETAVFEGK